MENAPSMSLTDEMVLDSAHFVTPGDSITIHTWIKKNNFILRPKMTYNIQFP